MNAAPFHSLDQGHELRRSQPDHAILKPWPAEAIFVETLGKQAQTRPVPPNDLRSVGTLRPEDVKRARERIGAGFPDQGRQALRSFRKLK